MNNLLKICILTFVSALTFGCSKLVEIDLPKDELTTEKVFSDSTNANAAIVGIYVRMQSGLNIGSGSLSIYPALSADELLPTSATEEVTQFFANALLPTNNIVDGIWSTAYSFIYDQNACIEGVQRSSSISAEQKTVFIAEARFIRSFLYFNLVNLYGAIPLVLSTEYHFTRALPRISEKDIYAQILEDLLYAKSALALPNKGNTRPNKDVVTALLARVYLYMGDYTRAVKEATELIESGRYTLSTTPNTVFSAKSEETIWGLAAVNPARATWEGFTFIPSSTTRIPTYVVSDSLLAAFENNDLRKQFWIQANSVGGVTYPYPRKYKMRTSTDQTDVEMIVVLRLAEQYLIRAEAYANMRKFAVAQSDINAIRNRAGLEGFEGDDDKDAILTEIERQRQCELMCEWGHRWYDLKRNKKATNVLSTVKTDWKETDLLLPIPQTQINRNVNLTQNLGY